MLLTQSPSSRHNMPNTLSNTAISWKHDCNSLPKKYKTCISQMFSMTKTCRQTSTQIAHLQCTVGATNKRMVHFKKLGREDFASKYGAEIQALNTASGPLLPAFSLSNWKIVRCCKSCFSTQEILPAKQWLTQTNNTIKCNCGHANLADDLTNSLK